MRVTVTQLPDLVDDVTWAALRDHVSANGTEFLLVGELCFSEWLAIRTDVADADWDTSITNHDAWIERLDELGVAAVAGTRPVRDGGVPYNDAYLWTSDAGVRAFHRKYYLPNEAGFWEAEWYRRSAEKTFAATTIKGVTVGAMICTDMWFTEHARAYAKAGVELLLVPRATPGDTTDRWLAGGRTAAVMSGAFCLSSNRSGYSGKMPWGAQAWIIDPEGTVLGVTTDDEPFLTVDVDLQQAADAKSAYPRYVLE